MVTVWLTDSVADWLIAAYGVREQQHLEKCKRSESMNNLFADISAELPEEVVETLLDAESVRIKRIVSRGQASPQDFWYDQDQHEWVVVLKGAAKLRFEDELVEMHPGDFINIPAHKRHRVEWTTPNELTIWLAVHYGG